jgi:hypothetical protein
VTVLYFARYFVVTATLITAAVFAWWSISENR